MVVDAATVGSKISRTWKKTVTDSFTWGLNQKIGMSVEVEVKAGFLMFGGGTKYTGSF